MVLHDYKLGHLQLRNANGCFNGNALNTSHVIGKVVEDCMQMTFNAPNGVLPVPIFAMSPSSFQRTRFNDVLVVGNKNPSSVFVKVQSRP